MEQIHKKEILSLKEGESYLWPESDYGRAEIWYKHETYFLFEIPSFGGLPRFGYSYRKDQIDELIKQVYAWS